MGVFNGLLPVLPGKEDAGRAFAKETLGAHLDGFAAAQSRSSVTRETWSLLSTPMGSFVNVWFEGDIEAAFADLATADDEHAVWFRQQILDVTGIDMSAPDDGPPPELILDWSA